VKHKFKEQVFRSCWTSYTDARHMMKLKVWSYLQWWCVLSRVVQLRHIIFNPFHAVNNIPHINVQPALLPSVSFMCENINDKKVIMSFLSV